MFSLCENMKWAHLPEPGGLYDQSPDLLEGFRVIFAERGVAEEEKRKKEEADQKRQMGRGGKSPRTRPSRPTR